MKNDPSTDMKAVCAVLIPKRYQAVLFHDGPRTAVVIMSNENLKAGQLAILREQWKALACGRNDSLDGAMNYLRQHGWPVVELLQEKGSPRLCYITKADLTDENCIGDGAYGLHDAFGSPEQIGQAITQELIDIDMMKGKRMLLESGQDLYLNITIKFCDPTARNPEEPMASEPIRDVPTGTFTDQFFYNKPALKSLESVRNPHPVHVRECILEMCQHIMRDRGGLETPKKGPAPLSLKLIDPRSLDVENLPVTRRYLAFVEGDWITLKPVNESMTPACLSPVSEEKRRLNLESIKVMYEIPAN